MANELSEHAQQMADDTLFVQSLDAIEAGGDKRPYLGDATTVASILRVAAGACMLSNPDNPMPLIVDQATRVAKIMLGQKARYVPLAKWNEPGFIDEFLAKWCGVDEADPVQRVAGAFIALVNELLGVANYAQQPGIDVNLWGWQVDAIFQKYSLLFIGMDLPTQAAI